MNAQERHEYLSGRADLSPMERGELRALRRHVLPAQTGAQSARERAAALVAKGNLSPAQRGELRAIASSLPAEARRSVERYLATW